MSDDELLESANACPFLMVDGLDLLRVLQENRRLQQQVTELQARMTEMVEERRRQ